MSSIFDNPTFYVSIFSSVAFVCSEVLPFLPIKSNGLLHAILESIIEYKGLNQSSNDKKEKLNTDGNSTSKNVSLNEVNLKLDAILEKLNSNPTTVPIFSM